MVNIVASEKKRHNQYLESVFRIYRDIVLYMNYPTLNNIYGEYCKLVDFKVTEVLVKFYPDEYYDGSPGKVPGKIMPDHMRGNMSEYIGMPVDVTEEIIKDILDDHQMFYLMNGYHHSPLKGVW